MHAPDHLLLVTFRLAGPSPEEYAARCEAVAPAFAGVPGLRSKLWLADPATGTYGGVYTWDGRQAMEAYLDGPVFGALRDDPGIAGIATRDFGLLEGPSRVTGRLEPRAEAVA